MEWGEQSPQTWTRQPIAETTTPRRKKKKMTTEPIGTFTTSAINLLPGDVVRVNIAPSPLVAPQYVWWTIHHTTVDNPNSVRIYYTHNSTLFHTVLWYCQVTCRLDMSIIDA